MKKFICLFLVFILLGINQIRSQVTIGSSGKPDISALLDLKQNADGTSDKGLLIPRVKLIETSDPSPLSSFVEGLIVYNIESGNDVEHGFYYCDGNQWILLKPSDDITFPVEPWLVAGTDEQANSVHDNIYHLGEVVIGRSGETNPQAELEVYSDSKGFLMPRLSQKQRDAIPSPVTESLMIWNIDESCYNFYAQDKWRSMCGDIETEENVAVVSCEDIKIMGDYKVGKSLNDSNYISVTVQVSGPCNLRLEGETMDGFYFQRTGRVLTSGTFTYNIPGYGTPRKVGSSIEVTVNAYNNSKLVLTDCKKTVIVTEGAAKFNSIVLKSVDPLTKGQVSAGKQIVIEVDVTTAGTFSFYTESQNGVQYSSTNQQLAIGSQNVILYSNGGIPTESGTFDYTISGNGGTNTLVVPVVVSSLDAQVDNYCSTTKVVGSFIKDVATTTSNYIECTVNFNSAGSWTGSATTSDGDFRFDGNGNISKAGTQTIRLYATGIPKAIDDRIFNININGVECTATVSVLIPPKNVLLIGDVSSAVNTALLDLSNFGPSGKSKIASINIVKPKGQNPSSTDLAALIADNNIDVILAGWHFKPNDATAKIIADFMNINKGFYFQVQGQSLQSYIPDILKNAYDVDVTFTSNNYPIYGVALPTTTSGVLPKIFLDGVFGSCENKIMRSDDQASWMGITLDSNGTLSYLVELPQNGSGANNVGRYLFTYSDNFFLIPDWGMLNYSNGEYGNNSPIGYNTTARKYNSIYMNNSIESNVNVQVGQVANWVLFGNVMDYIFKNSEKE